MANRFLTRDEASIDAEFPEKLQFLFRPAPNKIAYGGRDGVKSWGIARALLLIGQNPAMLWPDGRKDIRILCARETQQSIRESVHQLLSDQIKALGLERYYSVLQSTITCRNAAGGLTEFIFAGLRNMSVSQIKSTEGIDIVWVEEAAVVTKNSWQILIPTIRKPLAELWISFNPLLDTDDTYKRWVLNPPPGTVVIKTSYRDNRWLSERSQNEIDHLRRTDPVAFEHVYEGACVSSVEGAVFGAEMAAALKEGRIGSVPYNRARKVDTVWDLGFRDLTTVWFVQAYEGWWNFIDYASGEGKTITDWMITLQGRGYLYGTDWLPHDGVDAIIHHRLTGQKDRSMTIETMMRNAGRTVRICPKIYITDRINAARTIFPQSRFDQDKCSDGLQSLRRYQWGPIQDNGVRKREPLHDEYSHGADGFCVAGVSVRQPEAPAIVKPQGPRSLSPWG